MPRGRKPGATYLDPVRALLVAQLLLDGVSQREAAHRARVDRETVKRILVQLERGDAEIVTALARPAARLRTAGGRTVRHVELLVCLVRRTAIALVRQGATDPWSMPRPELVTAGELAAVLPAEAALRAMAEAPASSPRRTEAPGAFPGVRAAGLASRAA